MTEWVDRVHGWKAYICMVIGGDGNREVGRPQQIICHRDWDGTGALDFKREGRDEDPV